MKTEKKSRLTAYVSGLATKVKSDVRNKQINNLLEKAKLSAEVRITEIEQELEALAKCVVENPSEDNLEALFGRLLEREHVKESIEKRYLITDYLNEEVEVEVE